MADCNAGRFVTQGRISDLISPPLDGWWTSRNLGNLMQLNQIPAAAPEASILRNRRWKPMLRVTTRQRGNTYTFELSGVLGGEWVPMLEEHWRATIDGARPAVVTVVLSDVDFIDAAGERLLQSMAEAGVEFVVSGCMNRYVIENLQHQPAASRRTV